MKQLQRKSLYRYAAALFVFLCYLGICLAVFFIGIQRAVEKNTQTLPSGGQRGQAEQPDGLPDGHRV